MDYAESNDSRRPESGESIRTRPEQWLDNHGDFLYAYAFARLRNHSDAEEAVQETLLAGLRGVEQFEGRSQVRSWLCGILRHKVADLLRRRARIEGAGQETLDEWFDEAGHYTTAVLSWKTPRELLENKEFLAHFDACLQRVPRRQAQAFALREVDGMDAQEICKFLQVSSTNYWVLLHRARLALRQCLELNWFGAKERR